MAGQQTSSIAPQAAAAVAGRDGRLVQQHVRSNTAIALDV